MKAALTTAIFLILIIIVTAGPPRVRHPFQRVQICMWTTISDHRNGLQRTAFLVLWCMEASLPFGGFGTPLSPLVPLHTSPPSQALTQEVV